MSQSRVTTISDRPNGWVLVTGTSTGIGRACAIDLASQGFGVFAGVRNDADAKSLEASAQGMSGKLLPVRIDVTDMGSIQAACNLVRERAGKGGLAGIVNNAGICVVGPVECVSLDDWRRQFEVNLFGQIAVTQTFLPLLRERVKANGRWSARIVNIGSVTGEISTPLFGAYSASKFALSSFNDALRLEVRSMGIHVSLIVPGTIQSEIWRKEKEGVANITHGFVRRYYEPLISRVSKYVFSCADSAIPANRVAFAVRHAMQSPSPRLKYLVGWEAKVGSRAKRLLPNRLFNYLLGRTMNVPAAMSLRLEDSALPNKSPLDVSR